MKTKLFTLLTLLLCVCSGAWGAITPKSITSSSGEVYLVTPATMYDYYDSGNGWVTNASGGSITSNSYYGAKSGTNNTYYIDPETEESGTKGQASGITLKTADNRSARFYFTGAVKVSAFIAATGSGRSATVTVYKVSDDTQVGSTTGTTYSASGPYEKLDVTGLSASESYYAKVSATNDLCFYAIKFFAPAAPTGAYTITKSATNGTITVDASADEGATVDIAATPNTGYEFTSWNIFKTGDTNTTITPAAATATTSFTMPAYNVTVAANFSAIDYAITYTAATNGTYTVKVADGEAVSTNTTANYGQTITLAATPEENYALSAWNVTKTSGGEAIEVTNNQFTMPAEAVTIAPTFGQIYTVTFDLQDHGSAIDAQEVAAGSLVTEPTAPTADGYLFRGWYKEAACTNAWDFSTDVVSAATVLYAKWVVASTLFSMTNITSTGGTLSKGKTGNVTATFSEGGTAEVYQNASSGDMLYNSSINLNGSGSSYLHITFQEPLSAGDMIDATLLTGAVKIGSTSSNSASRALPYEIKSTDTDLIGATNLYFFKDGSAQISSVTILGEGLLANLAITSSVTPTINKGLTATITHTSSSDGEITYSSSDTSVATVSDEGVITAVAAGTAVITVSQAATATYRAAVATVSVTVPETAIIKAVLTGKTTATVTGTIGGTYSGSTQDVDKTNGGCKLGSKGTWAGVTLATGTFQEGDVVEVKITSRNGSTNFVFYDSKEQTNVILETEVAPEPGTHRFVLPAAANEKSSIFLVRGTDETGNSGFNPNVAYIAVYRPSAIVTLNASGFATYSAETDFDVDGATAYAMALDLTNNTLTGTAIDGAIPAGAGVLLKGEAGAKVAIVETSGATELTGNSLHGTTQADGTLATMGSNDYYVLSGDTFKKFTGDAFTANKAYFEVDGTTVQGRVFSMIFDDGTTTGVNEELSMKNDDFASAPVYNLAGQRVAQPTKGLYIVNGKKVVVK